MASNLSPTFAGLATLVSVAALIVTATIGVRQSRNSLRQTFTMNVMLHLLTNQRFGEAYSLIMRHAEAKSVVMPDKLTREEDELLTALLSMYEFIAINSLAGTMDKDIILRQRRSGLVKTHEICADYILHKRRAWDRPNVYRSFETLVRDHAVPGRQPVRPPQPG